MTFTLRRYQRLRPPPSFTLGGEFFRDGDRHFLKDALTHLEIMCSEPIFRDFQEGDLITVEVDQILAHGLHGARATKLNRGRRARPALRGVKAVDFAAFTRVVRDFFVARGLTELFTPTLVACPGLEPSLEAFSVNAQKGRARRTVYLPTSPEIHLKKALAKGFTDIFELKTCFRKNEFSRAHENEFTMLEWYRAFADLEMIAADLTALLEELHRKGFAPRANLTHTTFARLFGEVLDFELTPRTTREDLRALCQTHHVEQDPDDTFNDLFHRLLVDVIEPAMKALGPLLVRDFPPSQAALARLTQEGWADRFEFYWNGLEIANAFNEVTDPVEQTKRWETEQAERRRLGTEDLAGDPGLIEALEQGLAPTGGIALGVERLYMACTGAEDIRELRLFSTFDLFEA